MADPPLPPSSSYVLSLSGHRDLSRRRHETHDLNWCREQLQVLSNSLREKSQNLHERELKISALEADFMGRIRSSIDGGIVQVRDRVKAEYDGRLDRMEGVARRYQSYVDKVASKNREMKVKLAKMEKEKKQWEEGLKKKEEEMKRRRKREEVARWRKSKDEKKAGGNVKEKDDREEKEEEKKEEKKVAAGTAALMHQKLGLVSKQLKIIEMTLQGLLPLLPEAGNIKQDEGTEPHKLVGTVLPGLLSLLMKIDRSSPKSSVQSLQVLRSINLIAFHLSPKKPYTLVTKSVVLRTPDTIKDFLEDDDFRVRFEAAAAILRFGLGGETDDARGEILNRAAETLSIETSPLPSSPNPPQALVSILRSLELLLGMLVCTRGAVVTQGNKVFLHTVSCCNCNNRFKNSTVALLTSNDLLKNFVLDLYAPHTAVKDVNVIRSMLSEVREVFSMIIQIIGVSRPSWIRNVKVVIEDYVRSGEGSRFELTNIRSALEALRDLNS